MEIVSVQITQGERCYWIFCWKVSMSSAFTKNSDKYVNNYGYTANVLVKGKF